MRKLLRILVTAFGAWLKSARTQVGALCATYGLMVTLLLALHYTIGERFTPIAILNNGLPWISLCAMLSFVGVLLSPVHRRLWLLYNLPGAVHFLVMYGVLFLPPVLRMGDPGPVAVRFTAATYNIASSGTYFVKAAQVLRTMRADIIGFQEMYYSGFLPNLTDIYRSSALGAGVGILSTFQIDVDSMREIGMRDANQAAVGERLIVLVGGRPISVYTMHLVRPEITLRPLAYLGTERRIGLEDVLRAVRQEKNPVILFCDCNFSDGTEDYRRLAGVLIDTWREVGLGFGLSAPYHREDTPLLLLRGDYIWHSPEIVPLSIKVWDDSSSDHLPVIAEFGLRAP